jgi:hypothetical protein
MGSQKKVAGIYTRVLECYQQTFPWLKPHLISYNKDCEKKETTPKLVSAKKENGWHWQEQRLPVLVRAQFFYDCSSANVAAGTGNNDIIVTVMCHKEGRCGASPKEQSKVGSCSCIQINPGIYMV